MAGAVTATTVVGIIGFVVMLGSAVLGLSYWRGHAAAANETAASTDPTTEGFGLSVVEGGKKTRKRAPRPGSGQRSMMEKFEERWRRRRGSDGI
jgi:hypothetical protein